MVKLYKEELLILLREHEDFKDFYKKGIKLEEFNEFIYFFKEQLPNYLKEDEIDEGFILFSLSKNGLKPKNKNIIKSSFKFLIENLSEIYLENIHETFEQYFFCVNEKRIKCKKLEIK